jgi:putative spermidine/putrescine transport system substrate-binding protein
MNRRSFLFLSALGLAGCGRGRDTLRIFVYAGNHERIMRESFVPAFEAATGATCVLDAGWWDAIGKLKASPAGKPEYDLLITDATQGYPAIKEGMFAPLNLANIPNTKLMTPSALDNSVFRDRVAVPYPDSVMTLAYHRDLVKEEPKGWDDLLRPGLAGKVALYNSFYMSLYTFACMWAAKDGKAGTAHLRVKDNLKGVQEFAREHRKQVGLWWKTSSEMILSLGRKEAAACNMHSPEMLQALREDKSLAAVVPPLDRAFVQVMWCVPADGARKALAEKAIDVLFSPDVQRAFAKSGSATALPAVAKEVAKEDPVWASIYPHTEEQLNGLRYYPYDVYAAHWDEIAEHWERRVLRDG